VWPVAAGNHRQNGASAEGTEGFDGREKRVLRVVATMNINISTDELKLLA
jgi:hypothetical protein